MTAPVQMPVVERWLLEALIRGRDAEFVVGDIAEHWAHDLRSGRSPSEARRRLRRQVLDTCMRWWSPPAIRARRRADRAHIETVGRVFSRRGEGMGGWVKDLGFALRSLKRQPALALGVVLTLGLGVGTTTAIYSVVDGVLLRPLAFDDADRLVAVGTIFPGREWEEGARGLQHLAGTSYLNYADFRERAHSFTSLAASQVSLSLLSDQGQGPELVPTAMVTPNFWATLGVSPALGRTFLPDEFEYAGGAALPMILSYGAWQRRFGGSPDVLGQSMSRAGGGIVVGVLPQDFAPPEALFPRAPEFWIPLQPGHPRYEARGTRSLSLVGRLMPGVSVEAARRDMEAVADQVAADFPDGNVFPDGTHFGAGVNDLRRQTVGTAGTILVIFLGAAGLLLAIAVLNATTLLLARSLDRTRELGVRAALGAGAGRLVRLLLVESLALAVAGGLLGAGLGYAGVRAFHRFGPASLPRIDDIVMDGRVLAFTVAVSLVTGLLAGLLPALGLRRRSPWGRIRSRSVSDSSARLRGGLVSAQMGLALLLLSGAGLLFHSFLELRNVDPGFEPDGLLAFTVPLKRPGAPNDEARWQAWERALTELASVPGVTAYAGASNMPFEDPDWAPPVRFPDDPPETIREGVAGYVITPSYLSTVGTEVLRGRNFTPGDGPDGPWVALVNEAFVQTQLEPDQDPMGLVLGFRGDEITHDVRIVGVVEDVIQNRTEDGARPAVYLPYTQTDWPILRAVVRMDLPVETVVPEVRRAMTRFTSAVPIQNVRTLNDQIAATRIHPRFQALLFATFAAVALLLAAGGLHASLAHAVGRRRREMGIRMALGAARGRVRRMVLLQGAAVAGVGVVLGGVGAVALSGVLRRYLFEVSPADPLSLGAAAGVLVLATLLAAYLPARRATALDPVEVLKAE